MLSRLRIEPLSRGTHHPGVHRCRLGSQPCRLEQGKYRIRCFAHVNPRGITMLRCCVCCGQSYTPRPQVPKQAYCAAPDCQRARKYRWHQAKLQSDPDYRLNQRAAQQAWAQRHPEYWRDYRALRQPHTCREAARQVKKDVCGRGGNWPLGLYWIAPYRAATGQTRSARVVVITPVAMCGCRKMDASR